MGHLPMRLVPGGIQLRAARIIGAAGVREKRRPFANRPCQRCVIEAFHRGPMIGVRRHVLGGRIVSDTDPTSGTVVRGHIGHDFLTAAAPDDAIGIGPSSRLRDRRPSRAAERGRTGRDRSVSIGPTLADDPRKEAQPQLVVEGTVESAGQPTPDKAAS